MKRALLVVDVQNDFLPGGSLAVQQGDLIIPYINKLMKEPFDLIVATKDWHPANHGSFAPNHNREPGDVIQLAGLEQILWPIHCVQNTQGAEFPTSLDVSLIHKVFYKGTNPLIDSYSAFFDNGLHHGTGLHEYLQSQQISQLLVVGLATDYCVKYSVVDALHLGYQVTIMTQGCRGVDLKAGDSEKSLQELELAGALIDRDGGT